MQQLKLSRLAGAGSIVLGVWCSLAAAQAPRQPEESAFSAPNDQTGQPSPPAADDRLMADSDHPVAESPERERFRGDEGWQILTRSVEQRVIEYRQFGRGDEQILVVGPLESDEPAGVELIERLVDHFERFPRRLDGATVTVVRDPNPDGRLRGSRTNARGVRLDMNFPTRQWRKVPIGDHWLSGRTPESEPETRALLELLDDLKPDRIVLLEATRREAELRYSQSAEPIARRLARGQLTPIAWDPSRAPASLATYAGNERGVATLVLRVGAAAGAEYNWAQYKLLLLAAVSAEAIESAATPTHRLAAFTFASGAAEPPIETEPPTAAASTKRGMVLAAKELEFGGVLAPVVIPGHRPPAAQRVAPTPTARATRTPATGQPQRWMVPYRGPTRSGLPRQTISRVPGKPVPYGAVNRFSAPSTAPAILAPPLSAPKVERLPPVDRNPPVQRPLPQPIPLYPETGY